MDETASSDASLADPARVAIALKCVHRVGVQLLLFKTVIAFQFDVGAAMRFVDGVGLPRYDGWRTMSFRLD
jgi:hypothetical protein